MFFSCSAGSSPSVQNKEKKSPTWKVFFWQARRNVLSFCNLQIVILKTEKLVRVRGNYEYYDRTHYSAVWADLEKDDFFLHNQGLRQTIFTQKKRVNLLKKHLVYWTNTIKLPKLSRNCQEFPKKRAKSQDNTWFYQNSVKFWLHFTRDPKQFYMTVGC